MKDTCYMCENKVTSREHVPPKCLFPEKKDLPKGFNFRRSLITVPSCDVHNSHKSLNDEYLMFLLSTATQGNTHKFQHFKSKVMRAIERKPHVYQSFMADSYPVYLEDSDGNVEESLCYKVDLERFDSAVYHIACGIYYSCYKKKWLGNFKVLTNALMVMEQRNAPEVNMLIQEVNQRVTDSFSHAVTLGENSEIFKFNIVSDSDDKHAVHMTFYEGITVTVLLANV